MYSRILAFVRLSSVVVFTFLAALAAGLSALAVLALNLATWLLTIVLAMRSTPGLPVQAPFARAPLLSEDDLEIGFICDEKAIASAVGKQRDGPAPPLDVLPSEDARGSVAESDRTRAVEQAPTAAIRLEAPGLDAAISAPQSCSDAVRRGAATSPGGKARGPDRDSDDPSSRISRLQFALHYLNLSEQQVLAEDFGAMSRQKLTLEKQRVRRELDRYEQELAARLARPPRPEEKEEMRLLYIYYWRTKEALAAEGETDSDVSSFAATPASSRGARALLPSMPKFQAPAQLADSGRRAGTSRSDSRACHSEDKLPEEQGQAQAQRSAALARRISQVPRPQPRARRWR